MCLEIFNFIFIKVVSGFDLYLIDIDFDSNWGSIILDLGYLSIVSFSDDFKGEEGSFCGLVL